MDIVQGNFCAGRMGHNIVHQSWQSEENMHGWPLALRTNGGWVDALL